MDHAKQLRQTLATAIAAGLALHVGCDNPPPSHTPAGESGAAPNDAGLAQATAASSATAPPVTATAPIASASAATVPSAVPAASSSVAGTPTPAPPRVKPDWCKATVAYCMPPRTRPPQFGKMMPPPPGERDPNTYDKRGCVALDAIPTSCSGMELMSGPTVKGGKCCYEVCQGQVPPCGRPFVVDGIARVAPFVSRTDWRTPGASADDRTMDAALRARLYDAWLADAAMEHASVASFGRFALELLAVGAPAELVADAHRAALDEVAHARLCYAQAARYGVHGGAVGPAALDLGGMSLRTDLGAVVEAAVHEGCVGETFAAIAAAHALHDCEDEATREVLTRIAGDETEHAALAWRFVSWAASSGGSAVRAQVARAFDEALAPRMDVPAPINPDAPAWRRAGRLDAATLANLARTVREDVVRPCAATLV